MAKLRVVRVRVALDERDELHQVAAWRKKENLSEWLRDFMEQERAAYRRALGRRGEVAEAGASR